MPWAPPRAALVALVLGACSSTPPTRGPTPTPTPATLDPETSAREAVGTATDLLVVLNKAEATASLIDPESAAVVATIAVGEGPHEVAVSPDGRRAVVCNYGGRGAPGSTLSVIDLGARAVERTIQLEQRRPHGIQFLPDGRRVVVTVEDSRALICVDVLRGETTCEIDTDQNVSHMVAVAADGGRAYVANIGSGSVSVLDLTAGERIANIRTGAGAEGIDLTPDGTELWVTNREADTVSVIDTGTLEVVASLPSASFPIRVRATPDGRHMLVSNARSAVVRVFDVASRKESRVVSFRPGEGETEGRLFGEKFGGSSVPIGIVVRPDGARAYVAHANADVISVVDLTSWEVVGTLRAGREPDGMAWVAAQ